MLLPALSKAKERALRANCASNLRQIGLGVGMYATDNNDFVPYVRWSPGSPTLTYFPCYVIMGTGIVTNGYYSFGLLWRTKAVQNAKVFYCPSQKGSGNLTYDYYSQVAPWPSMPLEAGKPEGRIRVCYTYWPQKKQTEVYKGYTLPKVTRDFTVIELGGRQDVSGPFKMNLLNPNKSISTDLSISLSGMPHQDRGLAGLNALFSDGHVRWQSARGNPQAFDPVLWANPGADELAFRRIANYWQP